MNYFAIECTHAITSVALKTSQNVHIEHDSGWKNAAQRLLPLIQTLFKTSSVEPSRLDAIFLSSGPGSFTALRVGMSIAKGLAMAHDVPLVLIPTLDAMFYCAKAHTSAEIIVPVIYSKANEFYCGRANRQSNRSLFRLDYDYKKDSDLLNDLSALETQCCIVGRKLSKYFEKHMAKASNIEWLEADFFDAASLFEPGQRLFNEQLTADLSRSTPLYLKEFEAKVSKKQPFLKNYFK